MREEDSMETNVVHLPNGPMEYVSEGSGPVVLFVHGGNSNCRADFLQADLLKGGYRVMVPSRPGYGRTPIALGRTAADQAAALRALLAALGVPRAAVMGASAGGPVALEFARSFPDVAHCLLLEEAVTKRWVPRYSPQYWAMKWCCHPKRQAAFWEGQRKAFERNPHKELRALAKLFSTRRPAEVLADWDADDIAYYRRMLADMDSGDGFVHDMDHAAAQLEDIALPVLILHSPHDRNVPFDHAVHAHRRIRESELYEAPALSHLIYMGRGKSAVVRKRRNFLQQSGW
jgi:pimeloyl-ACP methyl ester carboxylesterase